MKRIKLTQGKFAIVDKNVSSDVSKNRWCYHNTGYAVRSILENGNTKTLLMHRIIIGAKAGEEVDHINLNKLDNRISNLRLCTRSQNKGNTRLRPDNSTGYKGVYFDETTNRYKSNIHVNGKRKYLGSFKTSEEAAHAYNVAAEKGFGDFALINQIRSITQLK